MGYRINSRYGGNRPCGRDLALEGPSSCRNKAKEVQSLSERDSTNAVTLLACRFPVSYLQLSCCPWLIKRMRGREVDINPARMTKGGKLIEGRSREKDSRLPSHCHHPPEDDDVEAGIVHSRYVCYLPAGLPAF